MEKKAKNGKGIFATISVFLTLIIASALFADSGGGVPDSADKVKPLKVGDKVPKATPMTEEGKPFDLNAAIAKQPTVLIFYRGRW